MLVVAATSATVHTHIYCALWNLDVNLLSEKSIRNPLSAGDWCMQGGTAARLQQDREKGGRKREKPLIFT